MTNYENGMKLERAVKALLEKNGYLVVCSKGSRGPVDAIAVKPGEILFVQSKGNGYIAPAARDRLAVLGVQYRATILAAYWHKPGRDARTVAFKTLTGQQWTPDYALREVSCGDD